jgi:hypothetical protein
MGIINIFFPMYIRLRKTAAAAVLMSKVLSACYDNYICLQAAWLWLGV